LFTYNGSYGSGTVPYVTGHINALFPWSEPTVSYPLPSSEPTQKPAQPQGMVWVGVQKEKDSFPGGMNPVPMKWNHLGSDIAMTAWAGSMCACVSEDFSEVAPAVCVGFTIDAQQSSQHEALP